MQVELSSSHPAVLSQTGHKMPAIGFGTWKIPKETAAEAVYNAIKAGYRLIDCAPIYYNEV